MGYPWTQGDELLAADLNAAIANSVALGGGMLPLNGSAPMTGPLTLSGNATLSLHAVPLQQLSSTVAAYLPLATGGTLTGPLTVTRLNISSIPLANPDGSPPAGAIKGDLYNNGGFVCVKP